MHPDKSAAVIGLLDLRPGITPEDFEKALEELDVDKVWMPIERLGLGRSKAISVKHCWAVA
jgi:hypothetical protein